MIKYRHNNSKYYKKLYVLFSLSISIFCLILSSLITLKLYNNNLYIKLFKQINYFKNKNKHKPPQSNCTTTSDCTATATSDCTTSNCTTTTNCTTATNCIGRNNSHYYYNPFSSTNTSIFKIHKKLIFHYLYYKFIKNIEGFDTSIFYKDFVTEIDNGDLKQSLFETDKESKRYSKRNNNNGNGKRNTDDKRYTDDNSYGNSINKHTVVGSVVEEYSLIENGMKMDRYDLPFDIAKILRFYEKGVFLFNNELIDESFNINDNNGNINIYDDYCDELDKINEEKED